MTVWMIATLVAFFVKGLCGFANTLVFSTILSFGNNNVNITPVELLLGYPTNLILAIKERKSIQWKMCLPLAGLVLLGCIPGMFLLKNTDVKLVKIFFGCVIVLIGIEMFYRELREKKGKGSKPVLFLIGLLSGILCGLYGIGALLGAYIGRMTEDTHGFKANICVVFLVENTFRIISYIALGMITLGTFWQALKLAPCMIFGLVLGMVSGNILPENMVKKLVMFLLMLSGIALITLNLK